VATTVLGTLVALLLNKLGKRMRLFVLVGLLLAWATPAVTATQVWQFLFDTQFGVVNWALDADVAVWLLVAVFLLRAFATTASVAGGGVGGLFIPLVVAGALLGRAVGGIVHSPEESLYVVVGIAAFLSAGYRVPLAAIMFVAETTGRPAFVVPGVIAAVTAELVAGQSSVTTYQRAPDYLGNASN